MGVDVYLKWKGQTQEEKSAQYTGFDITQGCVGYLRQSYAAGADVISKLISEEWEGDIVIPAATLRERLPIALEHVKKRYEGDEVQKEAMKSYEDFVDLAERKEKETGEPCVVQVSY